MNRSIRFLVPLAAACALVSCKRGGSAGPAAPSADDPQFIEVAFEGAPRRLDLEVMDVFLVENDSDPEHYVIRGPGVVLVGQLPLDARVGYGSRWEAIKGRTVSISRRGGDPREPKESSLSVPERGVPLDVLDGSLVIEQVGSSSDAKTPLRGRVTLRVRDRGAEKTLEGTIAVRGTTWG